jgi:hypothetical protein
VLALGSGDTASTSKTKEPRDRNRDTDAGRPRRPDQARSGRAKIRREGIAARPRPSEQASPAAGWLDDRGVVDELNRLRQREPGQFDEDGAPKKDTEAGRVQAEIEALESEIAELEPKLEQARRLAARAREDREVFAAGNLRAILGGLVAEGEAVRAEANEAAIGQEASMARYIGFVQRVQGLIATRVDLRQLRVPGLDAAAEFRRSAASVDLPVPIPELPDE